MNILPRSLALGLLILSASSGNLRAAADNSPVKTFAFVVSHFISDGPRHRIYASLPNDNEVAVIDAGTLTVVKKIFVGSSPQGMSISPDGGKLYIALGNSAKVARIKLDTLTTLAPLTVPAPVYELEAGLDNRLYTDHLLQLDATTGALEATIETVFGAALLQISPDRKTLYFGDAGVSPSTLKRYDVSTVTAVLEETAARGMVGGNGLDLTLSHDGKILCYPNGTGNSQTYATHVFKASDFTAPLGSFSIGAYPGALAFSPSDKVAYEVRSGASSSIYLYNTITYREISSFPVPDDQISDLITDDSGRYLFVADEAAVEVYDLDATFEGASVLSTDQLNFDYQPPVYLDPTEITATGLPAGLKLDASTGEITGTPTKAGNFPVVVTSTDGAHVFTANFTITLYPNERAANISTRLAVQTGDDVLIAGFIVIGTTDEEVVVRALGPSLESGGTPVSGRLEDPTLELRDASGTLIASNNDWLDDPQGYVLINVNLAPKDGREAGLYRMLAPGAYTVTVRRVNDTTGIGLAEVYDLGTSSPGETAVGVSRLANISTRGKVETGDNVMIGGVIVTGFQSANMLVRALGPSLTTDGVAGALADPRLDLYNSNGTVIASNNSWRDTQEAAIEASGLAPEDDREAAISRMLAPGAYTAIVSGVAETSGVALVEVYNLP